MTNTTGTNTTGANTTGTNTTGTNTTGTNTEKPIWDRGDPIDAEMLAFTVGDDWRMDQRLVPHELFGSRVHAQALLRAGILAPEDGQRILRQHGTAIPADAVSLGRRLADALLDQGAAEMVALAPRQRAM